MDQRIVPLIMCGGAGTRLWPASREVRPKQFLSLFGKRSTFQDTVLRVSDEGLFGRPIVITNAAYRFMVLEQLAEIGLEADILLEPVRRDSGPAIAAGAVFAEARDGDAIVLALAADHIVQDTAAFIAACRQGLVAAASGHIVTFGVQPERAATEYGYISPGKVIAGEVRAVAKFVEKPDPATAAGTAATSCSAPPCCSTNTARSMPTASRRSGKPSPKPAAILVLSRSIRYRLKRRWRSRSIMP
jgi:mannose-1-phosphate guanylyltransferase/mannose-6-phosphate isomerase